MPAKVANVPVVGKVKLEAPVKINCRLKLPAVWKLPPNVIVLDPLLTPVPP